MRKLITILLLLISTYSYGQAVLSGSKGWDGYIDTGADSLISRMETATSKTMTNAGKEFISDMFTMFKDSLSITSLQNFFDVLYFLDIGIESAGKLNWVKDAHNITNVNSVVFDTAGATGNGSTSYLNTNYNTKTQSARVTQNNASFSIYSKIAGLDGGSVYFGNRDGTNLIQVNMTDGTRCQYGINRNIGTTFYNNTSSDGFYLINRNASNAEQFYKNGVGVSNSPINSTGLPNKEMCILAYMSAIPSGWCPATVSFFGGGKSSSTEEVRKIHNIYCYWRDNKNSITFFNP